MKGLRKLHDLVEAHIRVLLALGISASAYGGTLLSVLVNKFHREIRLIVSHDIAGGSWDLDKVLRLIEREVNAKELPSVLMTNASVRPQRQISTAATLVVKNPGLHDDQAVCLL